MIGDLLNSLPDLDRRTLVFIHAYEAARQEHGQRGYRAFRKLEASMFKKPLYKQFRTVVKWLMSLGWTTTWNEKHWEGFIVYAFRSMSPIIPQPGQLRNVVLLKEYVLSAPELQGDTMPAEELEALYLRILRPEVAKNVILVGMLGLRNVQRCLPHQKTEPSGSKQLSSS